MKDFSKKVMNFVRDEEGLTMTEYAVAGGTIVMGGVAAFQLLGTNIENVINQVAGEVGKAQGGGG